MKEIQKVTKRTLFEADGQHTIIYQDNGYEQHIKEYNDGTREEWLEPMMK